MRGHATPCGKDPLSGVHSANVIRAGLDAAEDYALSSPFPCLCVLRMKDDTARGRAWTSRKTLCQDTAFFAGPLLRRLIEDGTQKLVQLIRLNTKQRFLF